MSIETEAEKSKRIADNMTAIRQTIDAYYKVVASLEFRELERMRQDARHNEAAALHHANEEGRKEEREIWQGVVAEKDAVIAEQAALIEKMKAKQG